MKRTGFKVVPQALLIVTAIAFAQAQNTKIVTTVAGGYLGNHKLATSASFAHPTSVAIDANGNLYVSDDDHCQIRTINSDGIISRFAGTEICGYGGDGGQASSAMLSDPFGIVVEPLSLIHI